MPYLLFPVEEYKRRCDKARELMGKKDLKGLFITEGGNYTYFSGGTRDFSFSRPSAILLPRKGEPIAITQKTFSLKRKREIWFDDVRVYNTMLGLPPEIVIEAMKEVGMDEGRVGAELGYEAEIGHGLGWGGCLTEPPHITSYDRTVIRPGMVSTIEPGINTDYGCYSTEMNIVVTEDGCEILNEMDWELRIIPI